MNTPGVQVKKWQLILLVGILLAAGAFKIYGSLWTKHTVRLGGEEFRVLVADTESHRIEGWSNHKNMGQYGGMLFVFSDAAQHTMVMRDMLFPLDIIWFNGRTIVDMAPNLKPDPAKTEADLRPYFARLPSTLVLEVPAGFIKTHGLKIGDVIEILK